MEMTDTFWMLAVLVGFLYPGYAMLEGRKTRTWLLATS